MQGCRRPSSCWRSIHQWPLVSVTQFFNIIHVSRRDHGEMELKVRAAHEQGAWCAEDLKALTDAMHEERAAREEAERQLAAGRAVVDGLREDWQRKLRDRRKEVRAA